MMKKNAPNVRPADQDYDSFENGLADLRGILNRSAAAAGDPRGHPQDDPYRDNHERYRDETDRRPQDRFYPGEEDDGDLRNHGYAGQNAASPFPASGAYGYPDEGEPYEEEYESQPLRYDGWPLRRKSSVSLRILLGVIAAAAVAVLFALFTSDATRTVIANAKEAILPDRQERTAPPEPAETQLTAGDLQLKDPARFAAQTFQSTGQRGAASAVAVATRENVATAYSASPPAYQGNQVNGSPYQGAPQTRALPAAQPFVPPPAAAPADTPSPLGSIGGATARRLAPDELSNLMRRARSLLAAGDIPSARLLLERAADAQEAGAAFLLAQTYDPVVLGTQDARRIVPDPAAARTWYERAAQLGSVEAQRRLGQLPN